MSMDYYRYNEPSISLFPGFEAAGVWILISLVIAIFGGIVLYFTFLNDKNKNKFKGFVGWMYDFLSFRKMLAETMLKIIYLISAIFVTLFSFTFIGMNFLTFLTILILGNIIARLGYEFSLVILLIYKNTAEINKSLSKGNVSEENQEKTE